MLVCGGLAAGGCVRSREVGRRESGGDEELKQDQCDNGERGDFHRRAEVRPGRGFRPWGVDPIAGRRGLADGGD